MKEMVSFEEARATVLESAVIVGTERLPLDAVLGRTLAEDVRSEGPVPPFDNSAMDGFAVRVGTELEVPHSMRVSQEIRAGDWPSEQLPEGTCARIMTGAPIPRGANAVAPIEWTSEGGEGEVVFSRWPAAGQYVRVAGRDVASGSVVAERGQLIGPPVIGMLATAGRHEASVSRRPVVAVITTGNELAPVGGSLGQGQIRDANGPALAAQVRAAGGELIGASRSGDSAASIHEALDAAAEADIVVLSGGVSVGKYDLVRQVLTERGARHLLWKVRQRPGKPLALARTEDSIVFGLPGNPVSSAVCFELYVRPAIATMLGRALVLPETTPAVLLQAVEKKRGLSYFVRGVASLREDGRSQVAPTGPQASNLYSSMARANCLIHLSEEQEGAAEGSEVQIQDLQWGRAS